MACVVPRSVVWATDLDVLPLDRVLERRTGYLVVRSPSNPNHYWGNFLVLDEPPRTGDGERWERRFESEFDPTHYRHRTFAWDDPGGAKGRAQEEFLDRGYRPNECVGLVATAATLHPHPRENREVEIVALDPAPGADEDGWRGVIELQVAGRNAGFEEVAYREFSWQRLEDLRRLFRAGRGAWYVARTPQDGAVVASCGLVVTGERGRFQAVDTAEAYRRRGICSRLVVEAGRHGTEYFGAAKLVIVADPEYHALGLYESLGFRGTEHVWGVYRPPPDS